ncbi:MAG TPA: hypothetical protein VES96_01265 [Nitrospiraceae bacterium]|nr:hypothetical protein [Nitrospiraceae bacterium]
MTQRSDEDFNKLERALAEAHRSRQEPVLGRDWIQHVMRDIRLEEARSATLFGGIALVVWRGAAVAATVALIVAASALVYTGQSEGELTALLSDELEAGVPLSE